jgi:hypothetical protein
MLLKKIAVILAALNFDLAFAEDGPRSVASQTDSIRALRDYVDAYDNFEAEQFKANRSKVQESWLKLKQDRDAKLTDATRKEIDQIESAIKEYEQTLDQSDNSPDEPYAMFNLARAHFMRGQRERSGEIGTGTKSFENALSLLKDIEARFQTFERIDVTKYLSALSLEALSQTDDAKRIWLGLARMPQKSIYVAHANITLGDFEFAASSPGPAVKYFQTALRQLPSTTDDSIEYERARISYRLMWASFKSANIPVAIQSARDVLTNRVMLKKLSHTAQISTDAVGVISDALYQLNDQSEIKKMLMDRALLAHSGKIGLKTLQHFHSNNRDSDAIKVGELVAQNYPLDANIPAILDLIASSYQRIGKSTDQIRTLETLALMMPKQSLWRAKNAANFEHQLIADQKSEGAARLVAGHYYDLGMASGNRNDYEAAASYYRMLITERSSSPDLMRWQLKEAHCKYFTGDFAESDRLYTKLSAVLQADPEILEVAAYQLVMTRERAWRQAYARASEQSKSPASDPAVVETANALQKSIDQFADRFPDKARTVDALLVAASINRDIQRYPEASRYWQRALVSKPTAPQRALAIRGILYLALQSGNFKEAVNLSSQFLKLEDWKTLGAPLRNEVIGILASASRDEAKRLNDGGNLSEAGGLLTSVGTTFNDLPERERNLRDGAFMLAAAGDWNSVQATTSSYLNEKFRRYADEMSYLLARSYEYQMRFSDASDQYLKTARNYPKFAKSDFCLQRAEALSVADDNYETAGHAALLLGKRSTDSAKRLKHLESSSIYFMKADRPDLANDAAAERLRSSKDFKDVYHSRLIAARTKYEAGDETAALEELRDLSEQLERSKTRLGDRYPILASETNYLLAEDERLQFEDFNIFERGGAPISNINQKAKYFEAMAKLYDRVARLDAPTWAAEARYNLGDAAESFAKDIQAAKTKAENPLSAATSKKLDETSQRLHRLARKYFGENLLARNRNPAAYRDNAWVKKSTLRLAAFQKIDEKPQYEEELQASLQLDIPQNWSL